MEKLYVVSLDEEFEKARKQQWPQKTKTGKLSMHQRRKSLSGKDKKQAYLDKLKKKYGTLGNVPLTETLRMPSEVLRHLQRYVKFEKVNGKGKSPRWPGHFGPI